MHGSARPAGVVMAALRPGRLCRRPSSGARVIERRTSRESSHRSAPLPLLTDSFRSRASFARRPGFLIPPAFLILFSTLPICRVHLAPLLVTRLPTTLLVARAPSSRAARSHLTRLDSRYRVHLDVPSGRPAERVPAVPRKLYSRQVTTLHKLRIRSGGKPQTSLDTLLRHSWAMLR